MKVKEKEVKEKEVKENAKFFFDNLEKGTYDKYIGKYALMKEKKVVEYYDTKDDARKTGNIMFKDGVFSIQKIEKQNIDLGYFSHAIL